MLSLTNEKKASTLNSLSCYRTVRNLFMACNGRVVRLLRTQLNTKGVVNRLYKIRATPYYSYSYNVDQKTYEGRGKQYGEYESLHIGDTITVYYQRSNPSNSEAYVRNNKQ